MIREYYLPNSNDTFDTLLINGSSSHQRIFYDEADEAWVQVPCEIFDKITGNITRDRHYYMSARMRNLLKTIEEILPKHCMDLGNIHLQNRIIGILRASGCVFDVKSESASSFDILYCDHTYANPEWERVFVFDGYLTTTAYIPSTKHLDTYRRKEYINSKDFDYLLLTNGIYNGDIWVRKYLKQGDPTLYDEIPEEVLYQTIFFHKELRTWMCCDPQLRLNKYKMSYKRFYRFYYKSGKSWKLLFGQNATFCAANKFDYKGEAMVWFNRLKKNEIKLEDNLFLVPCDNSIPITKDRIAVS